MKKLILTLALIAMTLAASANSARYFTRPQAIRVANTLDAQSELMIYCGYEYELATYVIINEVWAEPVNSKYYEIWLYGYDAYTGEEIYMPIDLSCIWLFNNIGNRMYSAAQYLRFRSTVKTPNFYWTMPPYNSFVRYYHDPSFNRVYTYHYHIHRYGWRPPAYPHHGPLPYHPYYMRTPHTPATVPHKPFTPGVDHPSGNEGYSYIGNTRNDNTRSTSFNSRGGIRTGDNRSNAGNPGVTSRVANSSSDNNSRGTSTNASSSNSRSNSNNGRGTTTNSSSNSRGTSTNSSSNGRGTSTNTPSNNRGTSTNTRGATTPSTRGSSTETPTNNRGTSTNIRSNESSSKSSSTQSSTTRSSSTSNTRNSATSTTNSRGTSANTRGTSTSPTTNSRSTDSRNSTGNSSRGNSVSRR
ncbi:MAG: hypothetical protein K6A67_10350 [Bacteroidales bacterium]|nr:hypothetical protein [Bacteroidales bacterium]